MFPDFLGIGATRSGTTWLDQNLRHHPQIFLPPIKELHYFDLQRPQARLTYPAKSVVPEMGSRAVYRRHLKIRTKHHLKSILSGEFESSALAWDYVYFLRRRSDDWYASLFDFSAGKVAGEITPSYGILDTDYVAEIHELMPGTKIIFLMRNPIHRTWSAAVNAVAARCPIDAVPDDHFIKAFNRKSSRLRDNYIRTIDNWRKFYPENQFFLGFLDDISERPVEFMRGLYSFLGVDASENYVAQDAHRKVIAKVSGSAKGPIPTHLACYLARMHHDLIAELHHRFGGPATRWLEYADGLLGGDRGGQGS